ncbi:isoprenoid synthase domain-containing protein, partial [Mucidula mucida]
LSRPPPAVDLAPELTTLRQNLINLLGSAHPSLQDLARHYFADSSSLVRSCVILLFARATNASGPGWERAVLAACSEDTRELDQPLTRADVLPYWNPNMPDHAASFDSVFALRMPTTTTPRHHNSSSSRPPLHLLPAQLRLAQIMEMIHVASILHDQVTVSPSDSSNKLCILGGDFLLGRASAALSRLGSNHVVELIGSVISNISEGRVVMSSSWDEYLKNAYLKTGSLMAKGARSAVLLAGGTVAMQDMAFAFGRNLGMAMQV